MDATFISNKSRRRKNKQSTQMIYSLHFNAQFSSTVGQFSFSSRMTLSISSGYLSTEADVDTGISRITGAFFSLPLLNTVFAVPFFVFSFRTPPAIRDVFPAYFTSPNWSSTWKLYIRSPVQNHLPGERLAHPHQLEVASRSRPSSAHLHDAHTCCRSPADPESRSWRSCAERSALLQSAAPDR